MAPEILRYEKYDAKCDLWSVGAVLYEISVGKPPYRAQNHMELIKRIERARNHVSFPKAEEGVGDVEEGVKKLIRALLKKNAVERLGFEEFFNHEAVTEKYVEPTRVQDLVKEAIAEPEAAPAPVVPTQPVNTFRRRKDVAQVEAARLASGSGIERNPLVGKDAGPRYAPIPLYCYCC
jgi:serine/threonine-protein kinase ULK/ATG1